MYDMHTDSGIRAVDTQETPGSIVLIWYYATRTQAAAALVR